MVCGERAFDFGLELLANGAGLGVDRACEALKLANFEGTSPYGGVLVVAGDEDDPTLEPGFMLKRSVKSCALAVLPKCGHVLNLEEPALFNRIVEDFGPGRSPRGPPRASSVSSESRSSTGRWRRSAIR